METEKRTRTVSKNGKVYYKNPPERNRLAQKKHYTEFTHQIRVDAILKSIEKGMCPRLGTITKYPELTEDAIMQKFRIFKERCTDPDDYLKRSRNIVHLFSQLRV